MGSISNTAISITFAFILIGIFASAIYSSSNDATKQQFTLYNKSKQMTNTGAGNFSTTDTGDVPANIMQSVNNLNQYIIDAQAAQSGKDPISAALSAFGILAAVTLGTGQLLLTIFISGFNFIFGLGQNIALIPPEWRLIASTIYVMGLVAFSTYIVIGIMNYISGRNG